MDQLQQWRRDVTPNGWSGWNPGNILTVADVFNECDGHGHGHGYGEYMQMQGNFRYVTNQMEPLPPPVPVSQHVVFGEDGLYRIARNPVRRSGPDLYSQVIDPANNDNDNNDNNDNNDGSRIGAVRSEGFRDATRQVSFGHAQTPTPIPEVDEGYDTDEAEPESERVKPLLPQEPTLEIDPETYGYAIRSGSVHGASSAYGGYGASGANGANGANGASLGAGFGLGLGLGLGSGPGLGPRNRTPNHSLFSDYSGSFGPRS
jgi:hypothetical protein